MANEFPHSRRLQVLGDPILGVPAERRVDGTTCPKCLSVAIPQYCTGRCEFRSADDHLHWRCPCGYEWLTACADHEAKE